MRFYKRLRELLENFNLDEAEKLTIEIHNAEAKGYETSRTEDRLWMDLTEKILNAQSQ